VSICIAIACTIHIRRCCAHGRRPVLTKAACCITVSCQLWFDRSCFQCGTAANFQELSAHNYPH
jgi:hypothetical protein